MAKVGLDLDGVLYPFDEVLKTYLTRCYGYKDLSEITKWGFYEEWGLTREQFINYCDDAANNGILFLAGKPYEGVISQTKRLIDAGHSLHIVTARNFGIPGTSERQTASWLNLYVPEYSTLTFSTDKTLVKVDYFLEDKVENYDALVSSGCDAWLIDRPWNRDLDPNQLPRRRVTNLSEYVDHIINIEQ